AKLILVINKTVLTNIKTRVITYLIHIHTFACINHRSEFLTSILTYYFVMRMHQFTLIVLIFNLLRVSSWQGIYIEAIESLIIECTHKYLAKVRANYQNNKDMRNTTKEETDNLLGLLYLAGYINSIH
ncbi:piggyBac transposable element-derived protein 4-like, partial [Aphis craccivora]